MATAGAAADDRRRAGARVTATTGLGLRTARGVLWALGSTIGGRLVSLLSLAILARLLAPAEFGVLAVALAVLAYLDTIGDLGTSAALVYWPSRWREVAQVTFVVGIASSLVWLLATIAFAPAIARFFDTPTAEPALRALAWSFPLRALGATHDALLQKELRFRTRLAPELAMVVVKAAVALALAAAGFGVWALVWGQLAGLALWAAALWIISPWRPAWSFPRDLARPVLAYGRGIVGVNIIAAVVHHADVLVVGRMLGATALGFYQIAYKIPEIAVSTVVAVTSKVLFPAFSKLHAGGRELRAGYLTALRYVTLLTIPAAITLFVLAGPMVAVLFGAQWGASVPIVRAFAVYVGLRSVGTYTGDLLKATGRSGTLARLGLLRAAILVPALVVAGRTSAAAVAWAMAAVTGCYLLVSLHVARRASGASYREMLAAVRPALLAGAVLAIVLLAWSVLVAGLPPLLFLAGGLALGAVSCLTAVRWLEPDAYSELLQRIRATRSAPASPVTAQAGQRGLAAGVE